MSYGQQVRPLLGARLPTTLSMAAVLAGDLLVLLAFVATGQFSHGYVPFWEAPVRTALVTVPVVVGWLALAVPAGLYVPGKLSNLKRLVPTVIAVWIGAALIGGLLRSTSLFPGSAPVSFLLANVVFGILFVVPWRVLVGWRLDR